MDTVRSAADGPLDVVAALTVRIERLEALLLGGDRWVSVGDAARIVGVHRSTVHRWAASGIAPSRRWRGRLEVDPAWVAATAAIRRTQPHEDTP